MFLLRLSSTLASVSRQTLRKSASAAVLSRSNNYNNYNGRSRLSTRLISSTPLASMSIPTNFPGAATSVFTEKLEYVSEYETIPTYRVLDNAGVVIDEAHDPQLDKETLLKMYRCMLTLNTMDTIMYDAQRQGRVSFYMTHYGEEATHMGSAAALTNDDVVYGQYREAGVLMYRGFTLDEFMNQCYSNELDYGKGRQMPVHYGSPKYNFQTISSPLGTQLPHAAGTAYALKLSGKKACAICYFGEGAASEGDFHAALNMAATTESPVIYLCRNNGYAISTPSKEQYRGDGIASRGHGYGIATLRVDGNDVLAVYNAVKEGRRIAVEESRPVLIESMTYRVGHHSTSDDSSAYRSKQEVAEWQKNSSPIVRFRKYLETRSLWSEEDEQAFRKDIRSQILRSFSAAEKVKKPPIDDLFTDVYDDVPQHLLEQKAELGRIMAKYPEFYDQSPHAPSRK
ncbi:hypothetical protein BASA81_008964 [Batrachochytrium salamandrivorans]|nr:hypothetical protein BASA81_008964 [Batrachochytrium salamandrivorans]